MDFSFEINFSNIINKTCNINNIIISVNDEGSLVKKQLMHKYNWKINNKNIEHVFFLHDIQNESKNDKVQYLLGICCLSNKQIIKGKEYDIINVNNQKIASIFISDANVDNKHETKQVSFSTNAYFFGGDYVSDDYISFVECILDAPYIEQFGKKIPRWVYATGCQDWKIDPLIFKSIEKLYLSWLPYNESSILLQAEILCAMISFFIGTSYSYKLDKCLDPDEGTFVNCDQFSNVAAQIGDISIDGKGIDISGDCEDGAALAYNTFYRMNPTLNPLIDKYICFLVDGIVDTGQLSIHQFCMLIPKYIVYRWLAEKTHYTDEKLPILVAESTDYSWYTWDMDQIHKKKKFIHEQIYRAAVQTPGFVFPFLDVDYLDYYKLIIALYTKDSELFNKFQTFSYKIAINGQIKCTMSDIVDSNKKKQLTPATNKITEEDLKNAEYYLQQYCPRLQSLTLQKAVELKKGQYSDCIPLIFRQSIWKTVEKVKEYIKKNFTHIIIKNYEIIQICRKFDQLIIVFVYC